MSPLDHLVHFCRPPRYLPLCGAGAGSLSTSSIVMVDCLACIDKERIWQATLARAMKPERPLPEDWQPPPNFSD